MAKYNVDQILDGIRQSDVTVLEFVYKSFYPYIKHFIVNNSGNEDDAKDVFQEAIVIIFRKLKSNRLEISCSFKTYLYSVCRLLWLKQLEKQKIRNELSIDNDDYIELEDKTKVVMEKSEQFSLYQHYFEIMSNDCKKVLELSLKKVSLKKIAQVMGYKSDKYAKKRKYQCKEKLIQKIKEDPKFKELVQ